jgi:hypothetical protein
MTVWLMDINQNRFDPPSAPQTDPKTGTWSATFQDPAHDPKAPPPNTYLLAAEGQNGPDIGGQSTSITIAS